MSNKLEMLAAEDSLSYAKINMLHTRVFCWLSGVNLLAKLRHQATSRKLRQVFRRLPSEDFSQSWTQEFLEKT